MNDTSAGVASISNKGLVISPPHTASLADMLAALNGRLDSEDFQHVRMIFIRALMEEIKASGEDLLPSIYGLANVLRVAPGGVPYSPEVAEAIIFHICEGLDNAERLGTYADAWHPSGFSSAGASLRVLLSMGHGMLEQIFALYEKLGLRQKILLTHELLDLPAEVFSALGDLHPYLTDERPWVAELVNELVKRSLDSLQ